MKNNYKSDKRIRNQSYTFSIYLNPIDRNNNEIDLDDARGVINDIIDMDNNNDFNIFSKLTIPLYIKKSVYENDNGIRGFLKIGRINECKYDAENNDVYVVATVFANYTERVDSILDDDYQNNDHVLFVSPEIITNRYNGSFGRFNKFILEPVLLSDYEKNSNSAFFKNNSEESFSESENDYNEVDDD